MRKQRVFVAGIARTPMGCPGKSLNRFISSDLAATVIKNILARTALDASAVGQVVFGQSLPSTMPNNIGHYAWLKAELPVEIPGYTVQANAASGLQAIRNAYYLVATGNEDVVLAGGADSYSAAPFVMRDVRLHFYPQDRMVIDTLDEAECCTQPKPMSRMEQFRLAHGDGESVRAKEFAAMEKKKAARFTGYTELVPISYVDRKKGEIVINSDEWVAKEPEGVLAPNADGAAATLIVGEQALAKYRLTPMAEILGFAVSGCDPVEQEKAGIMAVKDLLKGKGLSTEDIAWFEIAENSAEDVLECAKELGIELDKVNPFGGAIAFGKCDGAEGILMLQRLVAGLNEGEYGVIVNYSPGGMGMATLVKKFS